MMNATAARDLSSDIDLALLAFDSVEMCLTHDGVEEIWFGLPPDDLVFCLFLACVLTK